MDIENDSPSSTPSNNLEKFLATYNKFMLQNSTVELNPGKVLEDISTNILSPPGFNSSLKEEQSQEENNPRSGYEHPHVESVSVLSDLYQKGKSLHTQFSPQGSYIQEMSQSIKKLKDQKIFETLGWIEQLNHKLNKQFEFEVNRGIASGIYSQKGGPLSANTQNSTAKGNADGNLQFNQEISCGSAIGINPSSSVIRTAMLMERK